MNNVPYEELIGAAIAVGIIDSMSDATDMEREELEQEVARYEVEWRQEHEFGLF